MGLEAPTWSLERAPLHAPEHGIYREAGRGRSVDGSVIVPLRAVEYGQDWRPATQVRAVCSGLDTKNGDDIVLAH